MTTASVHHPRNLDEFEFWADHEKLADLVDFAAAEGLIVGPEQAADIVREPWSWTAEYRAMKAAQR